MPQNTGTLLIAAVLITLFLAVFAGVFALVIILVINSLKRRNSPSPPFPNTGICPYSTSNSSTTVFYNHITSITFYKNYIHLIKGSKISYYFRFHGNFPPAGFVAVDLKPFKEEDMTALIQAVTGRNPSITLDQAAAMVARGAVWSSLS